MKDNGYQESIRRWKNILYPYKESMMVPVRLLSTPRIYLKIVRIFNLPTMASVKKHHPRITSKYARNYLGLSLSYQDRGVALAHHYQFLNDHVSKEFLEDLMQTPLILWEEKINSINFRISMVYPYYELEGDLSLIFWMNSTEIFTLSITIIPGVMVESTAPSVILITRSQGTHGSFQSMRQATKILYEVTPASLLIVVVMAIAASFNITGIAGITSREQVIAGALGCRDKNFSTYEKLWISAGGKKINEKAYLLPTTLRGRPLTEIRQKHRGRTKRKREFKQQVFDSVLRNLSEKITKTRSASIEIGPQVMTGGNVVPA